MTSILDTPAAAESAFYEAFRTLDANQMREVWAATADVFCVHPGGPLLTGRDAVLGSWMEIFASADPPHLEHRVLQRRESDGIAVHLVEERIRPSGSKSKSQALVFATNVYTLTDTGWRLLSHHASTPLVQREKPAVKRQIH